MRAGSLTLINTMKYTHELQTHTDDVVVRSIAGSMHDVPSSGRDSYQRGRKDT